MAYYQSVPKHPHPETCAALAAAIPLLPIGDRDFATSLVEGHKKYKGWSDKQLVWADKLIAKVAVAPPPIPGYFLDGGALYAELCAIIEKIPPTYSNFDGMTNFMMSYVTNDGWTSDEYATVTQIITHAKQYLGVQKTMNHVQGYGAGPNTLSNLAKVYEAPPSANWTMQKVGDLTPLAAMMDKASLHLKNPAILLTVPEGNHYLSKKKIKVKKSKNPEGGYLITSDGGYPNKYYGKLSSGGVWYPKAHLDDGIKVAIGDTLTEFADNPTKVAGQYGHLHGSCCFCNKTLTDPKSTAVGYGPICAMHYGLPHGDTPGVKPPLFSVTKDVPGIVVGMDLSKGDDKIVIKKGKFFMVGHELGEGTVTISPGAWDKPTFLKKAEDDPVLHASLQYAASKVTPAPPPPVATSPVPTVSEAAFDILSRKVEYLF